MSGGDSAKIALGVAVGVGALTASAVGLISWYKHRVDNTPPKRWRRVGELAEINVFPVKSCASVRVSRMECHELGLQDGGLLRDRLFMIMSTVGKFITARAQPRLVLIQPEITGTTLTLRAPGMLDFHLDIAQLNANATLDTVIWGVPLSGAIDCGEEIARWLSRFIHSEDTGLRLIHYPHAAPTRAVRDADRRRWRAFQPRDTGAMHDTTSYMLMAEASLAELNGRLAALEEPQPPVPVLQFRPNLVVKGTRVAFEEDAYRWVRIGDAVVMRNVRPCTRCIFTNIDPETGRRNAAGQPLALLKSYRRVVPDDGPVLGIHLGMRAGYGGSVSVGDAVYVEDE